MVADKGCILNCIPQYRVANLFYSILVENNLRKVGNPSHNIKCTTNKERHHQITGIY